MVMEGRGRRESVDEVGAGRRWRWLLLGERRISRWDGIDRVSNGLADAALPCYPLSIHALVGHACLINYYVLYH
jgi:hypothetical protein